METILIATDFSDAAENAVDYGAALAGFFGAEIVLVNAFALPLAGYDSMTPVTVIGEMQEAALGALQKTKEKLVKRAGFDPGITCVAEPGSVIGVLSEVSARYSAGMIVMGMVGEAGVIKRHLIGSNALDAARKLKAPVIIVPVHASYRNIRRISLAFDMRPDDDSTLLYSARYFSKIFGARLEVVNVREEGGESWDTIKSEAVLGKVMESVEHEEVVLVAPDPGKALEEYYAGKPADLLIVHPQHHNFLKRLFTGSVTSRLAFTSKIPLLVIR